MTPVAVNLINQFQSLPIEDKQFVAEKISYELERARVINEINGALKESEESVKAGRVYTSEEVWAKLGIERD
jgi:hypothetical protein